MRQTAKTRSLPAQAQDLPVDKTPNQQQLANIKTHIDLILLAQEAIAGITSEAILQSAKDLNLESVVADRVELWRLRQSNPLRKSSGGRKKLDVEEARSLVLIICHLAKQHQELIRRGVSLLEQITKENKPPHLCSFLGDYLDKFFNMYTERMEEQDFNSLKQLEPLAFKLLIDLLFYSAPNGPRRLWLALLNMD